MQDQYSRTLRKSAVPPLLCLRLLLIVRVGGIAEEKVGVLRGPFQRRAGSGITREHEPQTPACRAQHIRGSDHRPAFQRDALAPLEPVSYTHLTLPTIA